MGNPPWISQTVSRFYHSTLQVSFPELPDKPTLSEDCGKLDGCSCLSVPVVIVGLERFTVGNLVPALGAVSIRRLIASGAGKLRSTFWTSNLLHKRLQCTRNVTTKDRQTFTFCSVCSSHTIYNEL